MSGARHPARRVELTPAQVRARAAEEGPGRPALAEWHPQASARQGGPLQECWDAIEQTRHGWQGETFDTEAFALQTGVKLVPPGQPGSLDALTAGTCSLGAVSAMKQAERHLQAGEHELAMVQAFRAGAASQMYWRVLYLRDTEHGLSIASAKRRNAKPRHQKVTEAMLANYDASPESLCERERRRRAIKAGGRVSVDLGGNAEEHYSRDYRRKLLSAALAERSGKL